MPYRILPTSGAVAVALVLEVGDTLDHPVVDLGQGEPLLRGALYGLADEVGIGQVTPGIAAGGAALAGLLGSQGGRG